MLKDALTAMTLPGRLIPSGARVLPVRVMTILPTPSERMRTLRCLDPFSIAEKAVSPRSIEYLSKVSPVSTSVRTFRPNGSAIFAAASSSLTPFSSAGPSASAEQSIKSPVLSRPEIVTSALPSPTS
ncbi:hypothetical protein D3C87_1736530 [compost metagenome]